MLQEPPVPRLIPHSSLRRFIWLGGVRGEGMRGFKGRRLCEICCLYGSCVFCFIIPWCMVNLPLKCRLTYLSQGILGDINVHSWAEHCRGNSSPSFPWTWMVEAVGTVGKAGKGRQTQDCRSSLQVPWSFGCYVPGPLWLAALFLGC